jgi:hypothetical protein
MKRHLPILLAFLLSGCASKPTVHGIPNFGWVDREHLICRGGEPTKEGVWVLKKAGVTGYIKLNSGTDRTDTPVKQFNITPWQQFVGGVKMEQNISNACAAIKPGTFIHCERGVNRTGTVVLRYRLLHGWSVKDAQAEADSYGWQSSLPGLKDYVRDLEKKYR